MRGSQKRKDEVHNEESLPMKKKIRREISTYFVSLNKGEKSEQTTCAKITKITTGNPEDDTLKKMMIETLKMPDKGVYFPTMIFCKLRNLI